MDDNLHTRVLDSILKSLGNVLQDDFVLQLRKLLSKFDALMSDSASKINECWLFWVKTLKLLLVRICVKPCWHIHALNTHVLIEVGKVLGLSLNPDIGWVWSVPCLLEGSLEVLDYVLVVGLLEEIWEGLNGWTERIKADLELGNGVNITA